MKEQENQDYEGFIWVQNKKISAKNSTGPEIFKKFQTQNRFETLQEPEKSIIQQNKKIDMDPSTKIQHQ